MQARQIPRAPPGDGLRAGRLGLMTSFFGRPAPFGGPDVLVMLGVVGVVQGLAGFGAEWAQPLQRVAHIDMSMWALPGYTLYSLCRGLVAYVFSLAFTLVYGFWAAKDRRAALILLPLLDILQSIPVLGFMPGLVLALVTIFPTRNVGLELSAVLMIFTGQAWNMTFSFYQSLTSVPAEQHEAASIFRFSWFQRLRWVELPSATVGLVWNSMMSMAGGWFFLMINEAFVLGDRDFRLPGLGSYMAVAVAEGDARAIVAAVLAMSVMIIALDQLLWRPLVAWSQKFRVGDAGSVDEVDSWVLTSLRRSQILRGLGAALRRRARARRPARPAAGVPAAAMSEPPPAWHGIFSNVALVGLAVGLIAGALQLLSILTSVSLDGWRTIAGATLVTLARVLAATVLATVWTVPAGLAIGLSPRLSRVLQPIVQLAASFPAPMLFPLVVALLKLTGVPLGWGAVLLMLMGTQWYILFNVTAGAMAIPADLREAATSYRLNLWARVTRVYLPAVFPFLVTGWVTAAGGAWNASIVTEYVKYGGETLSTYGVGAIISRSAEKGDFATLAASVTAMSAAVVLFNRSVWRRCYRLAAERYSLER